MNVNEIKEIVKIFESSSLNKMELLNDEITIKLERENENQPEIIETVTSVKNSESQGVQIKEEKEAVAEGTWITSPLVGTYYASNSPESEPFVALGQSVKKGEVVCIIEAMKMMNEIRAVRDGVITAIDIENGTMVEYAQNLICIGDAL